MYVIGKTKNNTTPPPPMMSTTQNKHQKQKVFSFEEDQIFFSTTTKKNILFNGPYRISKEDVGASSSTQPKPGFQSKMFNHLSNLFCQQV
jgi:hypothetical protein